MLIIVYYYIYLRTCIFDYLLLLAYINICYIFFFSFSLSFLDHTVWCREALPVYYIRSSSRSVSVAQCVSVPETAQHPAGKSGKGWNRGGNFGFLIRGCREPWWGMHPRNPLFSSHSSRQFDFIPIRALPPLPVGFPLRCSLPRCPTIVVNPPATSSVVPNVLSLTPSVFLVRRGLLPVS